MTQSSDERGSELRELFFETAQELLQSLNEDALKLEKAPHDREIIRSIRRTVHTLKGDAAAAGFPELSELAHTMEDALAIDPVDIDISLAELGFTAADTFGAMLVAYREQAALPDSSAVRNLVQKLAAGVEKGAATAKKEDSPTHAVWTEYERFAGQNAAADGKKIYHIIARIDPLCAMPIAARQLVANAVSSIAQILGSRPEAGATVQGKTIELLLASSHPEAALLAKCHIPTVIGKIECTQMLFEPPKSEEEEAAEADILGVENTSEPTAETANGASEQKSAAAQTLLRVDAERIDNVLNLVGELIIGKSMMQQAMQDFSRRFSKDPLRARFSDAMAFQARVLNDLQRSVMKILMVPV